MSQQTPSRHRAAGRSRVVGRPSLRLLGVLLVVLVTAGTTWFSGASFTSGSSTLARVGAAADYHPPTVSVTSPGATVKGAVQVQAVAADTGSGVARVVIEYAAAGSFTWTALCTDPTAPYACAWDTTKVNDGDYQLRATATDNVGTTATSTTVTTRVANPVAVVLTTIPDVVKGSVPLSATVTGAGGRTLSSTFFHRVDGASTFTAISTCTNISGATPSCSWATGTVGDLHDVQVVTTVGGTTVVSHEQLDVMVDNVAPTTTVTAPSPMSGTVQVTATPADEDSGVASVALSYRAKGTTAWTALCTVTASPWRCALDTTGLNGLLTYELRAIATDVAGNPSPAAIIERTVSNGLATITITSPLTGDLVKGTHTITTDYSTPLGSPASQVVLQAKPSASSNWVTVCTDLTAPYTCDWATAGLTSGSWDLRATMTYGVALTVTSPVVTVQIDNNPLRALDVQAANGGLSGKADAGDTLTFTYAGSVDLTSIKAGWNGTSTALTVTFSDKASAPISATDRATFNVPLGTVLFNQNYVGKKKNVAVPATMVATTSTAGGSTTTTIVVTLGSSTSGDLKSSTTTGAMTWTPSASARSTSGVACSTTSAVESGAGDRDL
ncbi:hypothetical protein GCM10027270_34090 [Nocardioides ginkgobilobae]